MSQSIKLYTMKPMIEAVCDSATTEATGHQKEFLLDGNPDTYWKPSTATTQVIDLDLQSAHIIDAVGFWIHDYNFNHGPGETNEYSCLFEYSDDDSSYTHAHATTSINNEPMPLFIIDITQVSHRYWRLHLYPQASPPVSEYIELSWIFLLQEYDLGQGDEYPIGDSWTYHNRIIKGAGGRTYSKLINSAMHKKYKRAFIFNDAVKYAKLVTAIQDSQGGNLPMILNLDGLNVDAVRFVGEFNGNQMGYDDYRPGVVFESIPYIPDGAIL